MCRKWLPLFAFLPGLWSAPIGLRRMNRNSSLISIIFFVCLASGYLAAGLLSVARYDRSLMHSISKTFRRDKSSPNWSSIQLPDHLYINSTGTLAFSTATGTPGLYNYLLIVNDGVGQTRKLTFCGNN